MKGDVTMPLKTMLCGDVVWSISNGEGAPIAEIHLDYLDQVNEVVLYSDSSEENQNQVLQLAASHARQYVRNRRTPVFSGIMIAEHRNNKLTKEDSARLMDFKKIPEDIAKWDRSTTMEGLRPLGVNVITAVHKTKSEAIDSVISQAGIETLEGIVLSKQAVFSNEVTLKFSVKGPKRFTFWNCMSKPSGGMFDLHIVPSYHPVMKDWTSVGMVNGSTDAYIAGNTIERVFSPEEARSGREKLLGSSWDHVNHPFYVDGCHIEIVVNASRLRSAEGTEELVNFLRASLNLDNKYVNISGGFKAPLRCAHNRLVELKKPSPWKEAERGVHLARGSEEHCVWAYRTLKTEGVLEKSHVPSWFLSEGWLDIYKDAEVRPGLF